MQFLRTKWSGRRLQFSAKQLAYNLEQTLLQNASFVINFQ